MSIKVHLGRPEVLDQRHDPEADVEGHDDGHVAHLRHPVDPVRPGQHLLLVQGLMRFAADLVGQGLVGVGPGQN